jgi:ribonuclease-3
LSFYKYIVNYFSPDRKLFLSLKNIFGYYPHNISLYRLAFRHKSVAQELSNGTKKSNERLEFLGDAVLDTVVADLLFKKFPYKDEGFLTEMRSKIVSRSQLNSLSHKLGLNKLINSSNDSKNICKSMNGDAFEAFIGALYLDKGYTFARKIIINRIINVHLDIDELEIQIVNYKSRLVEWGQKEKKLVDFKVVEEIGEGFKKQFLVRIFVDGEVVESGQDFSIKGAEQIAAEKAFAKLHLT